ncbi:MAG: exo-beta-N-acetylmuramidase NamZ family protein [Gemmatimonadota bacterium]
MPPFRYHGSRLLLALAIIACTDRAETQPLRNEVQPAGIRLGIEVLLSDSLHLIQGKRVGLITNHTGVGGPLGRSSADLLFAASGVRLTALFGPEHGIRGQARAGDKVASSVDSATGLPVYSLYGETRIPTREMLQNVDVLIYDIQDVGARTYTYPWTLAETAEAAGLPMIVLDRPNPIRADRVEGGVLDPRFSSFVGKYPVALRYGLTIGELASYLVGTGQLKADIKLVPMQGYRRSMWWNETGRAWINPSPNIRSPDAALLYPGTVLFEGTNLAEGRGTTMPFQMIGASWLTDAGAIALELNAKKIPGVVFDSVSQSIEAGYKYGGETIPMILIVVSDRDQVKPISVALELMRAIHRRHSDRFTWRTEAIDRLFGSSRLREAMARESAGGIETLLSALDAESQAFEALASRYRLYR